MPDGVATRITAQRRHGRPLDENVRGRLESGFGASLTGVRIHSGSEAAVLSRQLSSRAFTTGRDIFFGAGEFRPDTPDGEHMLAHEAAHVLQHGATIGRVHRVWDFENRQIPLNFAETTSVETVASGQCVFLLHNAEQTVVVKADANPIGLSDLGTAMHEILSDVKSVQHRAMNAGERDGAIAAIRDDKLKGSESFAKLGIAYPMQELLWNKVKDGIPEDIKRGGPAVLGAYLADEIIIPANQHSAFVAMTRAEGKTAGQVSREGSHGKRASARMRQYLIDPKHMRALGKLTAVDVFFGNGDRVLSGNLGNWFYDPESTTMTLVDHIDGQAGAAFDPARQDENPPEFVIKELLDDQLQGTAIAAVNTLVTAIVNETNDPALQTWFDDPGRCPTAQRSFLQGLIEGKKLLIKTFGSSRLKNAVVGRSAHQAKQRIRAQANQSSRDDHQPERTYYDILKARARALTSG